MSKNKFTRREDDFAKHLASVCRNAIKESGLHAAPYMRMNEAIKIGLKGIARAIINGSTPQIRRVKEAK